MSRGKLHLALLRVAPRLFAVESVDSSLATNVVGEWRGVYVDEDATQATWPEELGAR